MSFIKENGQKTAIIRWDHDRHLIDYAFGVTEFEQKSEAPPNRSLPVAVLYGPATASSGEITALSIRHSPLSRSFGTPTGGFASCTGAFEAPFKEVFGKAVIRLTTAYIADRENNIVRGESIPPDVPCDNPMERAIEWIRAFPR